MGWLWTSPSDSPTATSSPQDPIQPETFSPPPESTQTTHHSNTTTPLSRDEAADAEFRAFLASLQEPQNPVTHPNLIKPSSSPQSPGPSNIIITPTDIHAPTISCRAAFDAAFYCASLGGQFTNLYRYGQLRRCSQEWSDFWWCMRTNRGFMSEEERRDRVLERQIKREREKYGGERGSSEDVWERRVRRVEGAFEGDLESVMAAERAEMRRRMREWMERDKEREREGERSRNRL